MIHDVAMSGSPSSGSPPGIGSYGGPDPRSASWTTAAGPLDLARPRVMGILNVTPDSFYETGRTPRLGDAVRRAVTMLDEGADIIDIGGESTRPGAARVEAAEELRRVAPVIEAILAERPGTLISVDTVKAEVARAALDAGAAIVNDVSALRLDPDMGAVCAGAGAGLVLMHSRGGVETMARYDTADYETAGCGYDPAGQVSRELEDALARARAAGVEDATVVLDPGLGFSKRTEDSIAVLRAIPRIRELGRPVLVGPSRKRFIGELAGGLPVEDRLPGTIAACVAALLTGARIFRVHDVAPVRHALAVAEAIAP